MMFKKIVKHISILIFLIAFGILLHTGPSYLFQTALAEGIDSNVDSFVESPLEERISYEDKIEYIFSYISNLRDDDPLIEIEEDIWIKRSNLEGIQIENEIYYYTLFPHMSYDPIMTGELYLQDIEIVFERDGEFPVIIYTQK